MKFLITQYPPASSSLCRDSSVGIALGYGLDDRGFESRQELGNVLFTTASRPALGPTHPPIQWVIGALSLGVKWPEREAYNSSPPSAEAKNAWSYTSTTSIRLHGVVLSYSTETLPLFSLFLLKSKHCPQHPVLEHSQSTFLPLMWETKFQTQTQQLKNYSYVHCNV
jgi:hypothetical protein